jgi:hypothetical protein
MASRALWSCRVTSAWTSADACGSTARQRASSLSRVLAYDASQGRAAWRAISVAAASSSACCRSSRRASASCSSRLSVRMRWTVLSLPCRVARINSRSCSGSVMCWAAVCRMRVELPSSTHRPTAARSPAPRDCDRLASSSRVRASGSGCGVASTGTSGLGSAVPSVEGGDFPRMREMSDIGCLRLGLADHTKPACRLVAAVPGFS